MLYHDNRFIIDFSMKTCLFRNFEGGKEIPRGPNKNVVFIDQQGGKSIYDRRATHIKSAVRK